MFCDKALVPWYWSHQSTANSNFYCLASSALRIEAGILAKRKTERFLSNQEVLNPIFGIVFLTSNRANVFSHGFLYFNILK